MMMGVMMSSEEASAVLEDGYPRHRCVPTEWFLVVNLGCANCSRSNVNA
jgi:hypothetical protein